MALADWWAELRIIEREMGRGAEKPAAAEAGRVKGGTGDASG